MKVLTTADDFLNSCKKSGLFSDEQLEDFISSQTIPEDPKQIAELFVRNNWLTPFQSELILQGKSKGFILGQNIIIDRLGTGGMGVVYLAQQALLYRKVAIKVLPQKNAENRIDRERFFREARTAAALDHPNIVQIFDFQSTAEIHYLVMEYVPGSNLQKMIQEKSKLSLRQATNYIIQAARGLQHAHDRGVVHRDIKPSNLLVDLEGNLKILDMGLATFLVGEREQITNKLDPGSVVGTIDYLAPEQAFDPIHIDHLADIYSLGATLHALISGKPPFEGTSTNKLMAHQKQDAIPLDELCDDVPSEFAQIVQKMMAKRKVDRYRDCDAVIEALEPWLHSSTSNAKIATKKLSSKTIRQAPNFTAKVQTEKRKIWAIRLGAALAIMSVFSFGWIFFGPTSQSKNKEENNKQFGFKNIPYNPPPDFTNPLEKKDRTPSNNIDFPEYNTAGQKIICQLKLENQKEVQITYQGKTYTPSEKIGVGELPKGWQSGCYSDQSEVRMVIEATDKKISMANTRGESGGIIITPSLNIVKEKQYSVKLRYRTLGRASGRVILYDKLWGTRTLYSLSNTKDESIEISLSFGNQISSNETKLEIHNYGNGLENAMEIQHFEVVEELTPESVKKQKVIQSSNFQSLGNQVFTTDSFQFSPVFSDKKSTDDAWQFRMGAVKSSGTVQKVHLGGFDVGEMKNLTGDPSLQLANIKVLRGLEYGKLYRIVIQYCRDEKALASTFLVRSGSEEKIHPPIEMNGLPGTWAKSEMLYSPSSEEDANVVILLKSDSKAGRFLIKSIDVYPFAIPAEVPTYQVDFSKVKPFQKTLRSFDKISNETTENFPSPWKINLRIGNSEGEAIAEEIAGKIGLGIRHIDKEPAIELRSEKSLITVNSGAHVFLRINYFADVRADSDLTVLDETGHTVAKIPLPPTMNQWRELPWLFTPTISGKLSFVIRNLDNETPNRVLINSIDAYVIK